MLCDRTTCSREGTFFVGDASSVRRAIGHASCDEHLAEGVLVSYWRLWMQGNRTLCTVMPVEMIEFERFGQDGGSSSRA